MSATNRSSAAIFGRFPLGLRLAAFVPLGLLATACGAHDQAHPGGEAGVVADWRQMATNGDRERLRGWRDAWLAGVDAARKSGHGAALDAEGALFDPDREIDGAVPPPGIYTCRVFKLGAQGTAAADFTTFPVSDCRIDLKGNISRFSKLSGSQRPSGMIFHDSTSRATFLGTLMLGDETRMIAYGRDSKRDMIGFVDRIAPGRWRMVLPSPNFESKIDIIELVPKAS